MPQILFFIGAGASAESGIPTFRKSEDALWGKYDVNTVCNVQTFVQNKNTVFEFYNKLKNEYKSCPPNAFHHFVAATQKKYGNSKNGDSLVKIYTSNIDNLLEQAGATNVRHVHGKLDQMNCAFCYHTWDLPTVDSNFIQNDVCPNCGRYKYSKPGVIFFGEQAPMYPELINTFNHDKDSINFGYADEETLPSIKVVVGASLEVIRPEHLSISKDSHHGYSILVDPKPKQGSTAIFHKIIGKSACDSIDLLNQHLITKMGY